MFRILDLFCGVRGFFMGLGKNKYFKTLIGLDFQQSAIDTFQHNFFNQLEFVVISKIKEINSKL